MLTRTVNNPVSVAVVLPLVPPPPPSSLRRPRPAVGRTTTLRIATRRHQANKRLLDTKNMHPPQLVHSATRVRKLRGALYWCPLSLKRFLRGEITTPSLSWAPPAFLQVQVPSSTNVTPRPEPAETCLGRKIIFSNQTKLLAPETHNNILVQ